MGVKAEVHQIHRHSSTHISCMLSLTSRMTDIGRDFTFIGEICY